MESRILPPWLPESATIAAFAAVVRGETATLELKKLSPPKQVIGESGLPADYLYRSTYPQHFNTQIALGKNRVDFPDAKERDANFKKIIAKEPKYESENPFRGVVKFGTKSYGYVLDAVPEKAKVKEDKKDAEKPKSDDDKSKDDKADAEKPKPPAKAIKYNRLYFDLNRNGDLTDDKVIEAAAMPGVVFPADNYVQFQLPADRSDDRRGRYAGRLCLHGQRLRESPSRTMALRRRPIQRRRLPRRRHHARRQEAPRRA